MNTNRKVAIVTGAGSGIGRATTRALLRAGYCVTLAGRRQKPLQNSVDGIEDFVGRTLIVPTDIADRSSVTELFGKSRERFGRLDLLFNNAGTGAPAIPLEEVTAEQWQAVVDANLTGAFFCTQEAFKAMKDQQPQGGRIVNNGSISAHVPRPNSAPYTATKHAITGLTRSTSLDGREYNIACGQIDIGNAVTDMSRIIQEGVPQANGSIVSEAMMDAEDVANAVVHMASLPLDTNVQFMTIMATKMPFIGRG